MFTEPESSLINKRVVYSNTIYMMPKIVLVTEYGLISVFNRWMAGATGIDQGTSLSWARVRVTSPDHEIRSQSHRCERIDLNLGGSLILGFVIRSTYFGLILRLDLDIL